MLYIDPDTCIDCNLCVDECPVTAIFPQEDLPAEWASFIERNTAYYKKQPSSLNINGERHVAIDHRVGGAGCRFRFDRRPPSDGGTREEFYDHRAVHSGHQQDPLGP